MVRCDFDRGGQEAGTRIGKNRGDCRSLDPKEAEEILSRANYYPGWHMNKKSWYTLILDGSISDGELKERLRESYRLAGK